MKSILRELFELTALFCLSLFIFTWGVYPQEIIGFESRFYMFAMEMWRNGLSWFPTTYGELYPDYLATSTWLIYFSSVYLGGLSKLSAVLPTATAGALTVVFTYMLGSLQSKRYGLYGVFFLFMTVMFMRSARSVALDIYPALITTMCFYIVYSADVKDKHDREWWLLPLMLLGFAFRGPIGLIIPAGVVCVYYVQTWNMKRLFYVGAFALLLLVVSLFAMLLLADHIAGDSFVTSVLRMQVVGRLGDSRVSPYYYFINSLTDYALSFPLAVILAVGTLYYKFRLHYHSKELKLLLYLIGWVAIILIGMSVPGDKKERYVLAIAPAIALLAAYFFVASKRDRYFSRAYWILLRLFVFFPALLLIGLRLVMRHAQHNSIAFAIDYLLMTQLLFAGLAINFLLYVIFEKKAEWRDTGILLVATLCFVACYLKVAEPIEQFIDRTRAFVGAMEIERAHKNAALAFYREDRDGMPIKYLINAHGEPHPLFLKNQDELFLVPVPTFFVTSKSYYMALPKEVLSKFRIVGEDNIGHVSVVVFTQRVL